LQTSVQAHESRPPIRSSPPPRLTPGKVIAAIVLLALVVFLLVFQWNWLRGPLARAISARIHRPVAITGNLEVHPWSWTPRATINGLVIGNPPWAGRRPLATVPRMTVQARLLPLFTGRLEMPLVDIDRPDIGLVIDAGGRSNWVFNPNKPANPPAIEHLIIRDGRVRYDDAPRRANFAGVVTSNEQAAGAERGRFVLSGGGTLAGTPFTLKLFGGPLLHIDRSRPYGFEAHVASGRTQVGLTGQVLHPFDLGGVSGRLAASGADLADLYHLTGLALPNTPPYRIDADFTRDKAVFGLRNIRGRMGGSDLEGVVTVNDTTGRPFVRGDLRSRRLRLVDLGAVTGAVPKHAAGQSLSPAQIAMAAKLRAEHRILPDSHLDVERIRGMDAKVDYRAQSVEAGHFPIRALRLDVSLDHALLNADPIDLTLPQGRLTGTVRLDARRARPSEAIDLRLSNARLEQLVTTKKNGAPLAGGLYARAKLSTTGDSVRAAAAGADGQLTVVIPGGEVRQAFAELMGIDATKALLLLVAKNNKPTPIRCAVIDFQARDGVMTAQRFIVDTGVVQILGSGEIDMRNETADLRLAGKPKKFRLVRVNAPITFSGAWVAPKIGVDIAKALPQAALSTAVGILAAPLAAILPFVSPGLARNADCAALVTEAEARGAPVKNRR
jgi:uncharacterized protein involved in outer membrane biogenesis